MDFLNLSANGYTSKEYETSKVWIDDNFTSGEGMLPIGTATITLQVPNDNNGHGWTFYMSTDSSVAITFATSDSGNIYVPDGLSLVQAKDVRL